MDPKEQLVKALSKKQEMLGLTHEQFADLLGVNRSTWDWVRKGVNNPGLRMLAGISKNFPDLQEEMVAFLKTYQAENESLVKVS